MVVVFVFAVIISIAIIIFILTWAAELKQGNSSVSEAASAVSLFLLTIREQRSADAWPGSACVLHPNYTFLFTKSEAKYECERHCSCLRQLLTS